MPDMDETMSGEEVRQWWRALMENVVALLEDAHLLLVSGSSARGRSLGILAQEELGKALWLYDAAHPVWTAGHGSITLPDKFEAMARKHPPKLIEALSFGQQLAGFWGDYSHEESRPPELWLERFEREAAEKETAADRMNQDKQSGFYVDRKQGTLHTPADVGPQGIEEALKRSTQVAEMLLITDHSRMKHHGVAYDSTHDLQMRLLPFSHAEEYFHTRTE